MLIIKFHGLIMFLTTLKNKNIFNNKWGKGIQYQDYNIDKILLESKVIILGECRIG